LVYVSTKGNKEDIVTLRTLITYATHFTEAIRLSVAGKIH